MKKILASIAFLITVQIVSAQSNEVNENSVFFNITISDNDALNAKSLKNLQSGRLVKGESRTTFIVSTSKSQISAFEQELKELFPSVTIKKERHP